ncbi:methionine--tRNA ligase [Mycoplasmoides genitalium]
MKRCYITTPIYYASGKPHIGHAFTTILADAIKRFKIQNGYEAFLLVGSDEHGNKIESKAKSLNLDPKTFVDINAQAFKLMWKTLNISFDHFIRTTDEIHKQQVQKTFQDLYDKKLIYQSEWKGAYCVECEQNYFTFNKQTMLCEIGHNLSLVKEPCWFISFSSTKNWIETMIGKNQLNIVPKSRASELKNNFINNGLNDLALTRKNVTWGIKVPFDPNQTIYVWFDALFSYITNLGFRNGDPNFIKWWNNDNKEREVIHLISREITRFHCIYWPIFLHLLDIKLPTQFLSHGWIVDGEGRKMSKSLNNVISPEQLIDQFGVDGTRYCLLKEMRLDKDNRCSISILKEIYNADLANSFGNHVSRTFGMIKKYLNGKLEYQIITDNALQKIMILIDESIVQFDHYFNSYEFYRAINLLLKIVFELSKLIDDFKPWELFKNQEFSLLKQLLFTCVRCVQVCYVLLTPILVNTASKVFHLFNFADDACRKDQLRDATLLKKIIISNSMEVLFKRVD